MADSAKAEAEEVAILGGGCFWCLEAVFKELRGVISVMPGYAGGHVENPTYEQVCTKRTGHAEVVRIVFIPTELPYAELLRVFFSIHDPTTCDRQGADIGPQYRSVIFYTSPEQRTIAQMVMAELARSGRYAAPIVTQLCPEAPFWPAEPEHHDYYARNPWSGYCRAVITPKVVKLRRDFAARLKPLPRARAVVELKAATKGPR